MSKMPAHHRHFFEHYLSVHFNNAVDEIMRHGKELLYTIDEHDFKNIEIDDEWCRDFAHLALIHKLKHIYKRENAFRDISNEVKDILNSHYGEMGNNPSPSGEDFS